MVGVLSALGVGVSSVHWELFGALEDIMNALGVIQCTGGRYCCLEKHPNVLILPMH